MRASGGGPLPREPAPTFPGELHGRGKKATVMNRTAWRWVGTGVLAGAATFWPVTGLGQSSGGSGSTGSGASAGSSGAGSLGSGGTVGGNAGAPMGTGTAGTTTPRTPGPLGPGAGTGGASHG